MTQREINIQRDEKQKVVDGLRQEIDRQVALAFVQTLAGLHSELLLPNPSGLLRVLKDRMRKLLDAIDERDELTAQLKQGSNSPIPTPQENAAEILDRIAELTGRDYRQVDPLEQAYVATWANFNQPTINSLFEGETQ